MLSEEIQIFDLFDEFYLVSDEVKIIPIEEDKINSNSKSEFTFTGTNKRKTVFVYNDKNQLSDNDLIMIENIVTKGIGWRMDEIVEINISQNKFATIHLIKDFFNPNQIIFWGCSDFLSLNKIPQKLNEILRGKEINVLTVNEVPFYNTNDKKKLLWKSIQNLLNLQ